MDIHYVTVFSQRCPICGQPLTFPACHRPGGTAWAECDTCDIAGTISIGAIGVRSITFEADRNFRAVQAAFAVAEEAFAAAAS